MMMLPKVYSRSVPTRLFRIRPKLTFRYLSNESDSASKGASDGDSNQKQDTDCAEVEELKARINQLEKDVKDSKDMYIRVLADSENLRERTRREKEITQQLAIKKFAFDLVSVCDIMELAVHSVKQEDLKSENESSPLKNLYTGLNMTFAELKATLRRHGVEPFDPVGKKFDPNMHQAMFQAPNEKLEPGCVFTVTKKGYTLHGILIRAAQVGVVSERS